MAFILAIESSTKNCSVALFKDQNCLALVEEAGEQFIHSEKLHLFIDELLKGQRFDIKDLSAVAVGAGPGSYTGLRIGLSAAKGIAFALELPLISADSLEILSHDLLQREMIADAAVLHPMIDARRKEVYTASFNKEGRALTAVEAQIIEEDIYQDQVPRYFFGDGASKFKTTFIQPNYYFPDLLYPSAKALGEIAWEKYKAQEFEDLAYFTPLYIKNFQAGKPKKLL